MDVTTQRRILTTLTSGLLLGAVGAVGWSLSGIETAVSEPTAGGLPVTESVTSIADVGISNEQLAAFALRGPLVDPPPPQPRLPEPKPIVSQPKPKTMLQLTLVGTIIGADNRLAILTDPSGNFDVKGIGEALELSPAGVSVQRIESEQVELEFQGKRSTVKLDKESKAADGNRRSGKARRRDR